jgi:hypothetical protein
MKINNEAMYEELIKEVMHPRRVNKYLFEGYDYIEALFDD